MLLIKFLTFVLIITPLIFSKVIEDPGIFEIDNYNRTRTEENSKVYLLNEDEEIENKFSSKTYNISKIDNNTKTSAKENSERYPISVDEESTTITNKVKGHSETTMNKEMEFLKEFLQVDVNKIKNPENAKAVLIKYLEYYDTRLKFDNFEISNFDSKLKNLIEEYQSSDNHTLSLTTSYNDKLNNIISYYNLKNNVDSGKSIFSFINSSDDNSIDNYDINRSKNISLQLAMLILNSADESCRDKEKCGFQKNENTNLANNEIYNLIPTLRTMNETDADIYFSEVLFPSAKALYNEKMSKKENNSNNILEKIKEFQNKNILKPNELLNNKINNKIVIEHVLIHLCGKQSDNTIYHCNNNLCCGSNGKCGNTEEFCGNGCNPEYGYCW